jgi:hypothetical protein
VLGPRDPQAVARALRMPGYRVGLTAPGSRPRPPGLGMGFRMPRPATDKCASSRAVLHQFRRPFADLRWTFQVPRGMVPITARSKGPITCAVLLTQQVPQRPAPRPADRPVQWGADAGYIAMNTMMAAGGCSAGRIGVTRATPDPDGG